MKVDERRERHRKIVGIGQLITEVNDLKYAVGKAETQLGVIPESTRWEIEEHLRAVKDLLRAERNGGKS